MRILVTGGAGFIGSHLTNWLVEQGHAVRVLDNLSTGKQASLQRILPAIDLIVGDIRDPAALAKAVEGIDLIFHLAAMVSVVESVSRPSDAYAINLAGTQAVFEAARAAHVPQVVQASTCAVYGNTERLPAQEHDLPAPMSPYAATKLASEHLGQLYTQLYGLNVIALRFFNVYGPGQDPNSPYAAAIPRFIRSLQGGIRPVIFGDGLQTRDFVYVGDIVRALWAASQSPSAVGSIFNVGRGEECTIIDLVRTLAQQLNVPAEPDFQPARDGEVRRSCASTQRLTSVVGFRATTDLATGLSQTLQA